VTARGLAGAVRRAWRRRGLLLDPYARPSYSQEGEDLVLLGLFEGQPAGTFVDVGAHHPRRFSNTHLLSEAGWRGLNIDPLPGTAETFRRERPHDVTVECGIAEDAGELAFFRFVEPALSTFDPDLAAERQDAGWPLAERHTIAVRPLAELVTEHLRTDRVDLLTVDVEGLDLQVLASAGLGRIRYDVICVEALRDELTAQGPLHELLDGHGYVLVAATGRSRIYRSR
jgi:FkbM family methyltransferase